MLLSPPRSSAADDELPRSRFAVAERATAILMKQSSLNPAGHLNRSLSGSLSSATPTPDDGGGGRPLQRSGGATNLHASASAPDLGAIRAREAAAVRAASAAPRGTETSDKSAETSPTLDTPWRPRPRRHRGRDAG